jgi:hypothetical protein
VLQALQDRTVTGFLRKLVRGGAPKKKAKRLPEIELWQQVAAGLVDDYL